jgi:hypothetical protein
VTAQPKEDIKLFTDFVRARNLARSTAKLKVTEKVILTPTVTRTEKPKNLVKLTHLVRRTAIYLVIAKPTERPRLMVTRLATKTLTVTLMVRYLDS